MGNLFSGLSDSQRLQETMRRKPPAMSISVEPEMEEASFTATGIAQRVAITAASLFSEPPPLSRLCLSRYDLHPRWSKLRHHDVWHHERRWAGTSLHAGNRMSEDASHGGIIELRARADCRMHVSAPTRIDLVIAICRVSSISTCASQTCRLAASSAPYVARAPSASPSARPPGRSKNVPSQGNSGEVREALHVPSSQRLALKTYCIADAEVRTVA